MMLRKLIPAAAAIMLALAFVPRCAADRYQVPVIQLESALNTPSQIYVDRNGFMYIMDIGRQMLMKFSMDGKLVGTWPTSTHEVQYPNWQQWVYVDDDGTILLGPDESSNSIKRIAPDGSVTVLAKDRQELYMPVFSSSSDGSYSTIHYNYATKDNGGVYDLEWVRVDVHARGGNITRSYRLPPMHYTAGRDGLFYGYDSHKPVINVYSADARLLRQIDVSASWDKGANEMQLYYQVAENGDIYVAWDDIYCRYDSSGKLAARWAAAAPYIGDGIANPRFTVKNGLVYVILSLTNARRVDKSYSGPDPLGRYNEIRVYNPDGQCVASYVPKQSELNMPASIAAAADGTWAVSMFGTNQIRIYQPDGTNYQPSFIRQPMHPTEIAAKPGGGFYFGLEETDADGMPLKSFYSRCPDIPEPFADYPVQIAIDPTTKELWTLGCGGSVWGFTPEGKIIKQLGMKQELNFHTWAMGLAIDSHGFIYLPDPWKHRVVKIDKDANIITQWGTQGSGLGEMSFPEGIVIDSHDRVYVADCENSRIQVFDTNGKPLGVWGSYGSGDGQLNRPWALAMGPKNTLWISDTFNDRIVKVPLDRFWSQVSKTVAPASNRALAKTDPAPEPGEVSVSGYVVAGSDDLSDCVYIESPDRAWGVRVALPEGKAAKRGEFVKVKGKLAIKERGSRHLAASSVEQAQCPLKTPGPLGMANLYVGDGYRQGSARKDLSNQAMLVLTWGRVTSVERDRGYFVINDGSYPAGTGVVVYAGQLTNPLAAWPQVGQYLGVTGISATVTGVGATPQPAVRVRNQNDMQVFADAR